MAKVASATKNKGARKASCLQDPAQTLPRREIFEQRVVEWRGRVDQGIVDPVLCEPRGERENVFLDERAILLGERRRHHRNLLAGFEILEARRVVEVEVDLG